MARVDLSSLLWGCALALPVALWGPLMRTRAGCWFVALVGALGVWAPVRAAYASPWTLPQHELVLSTDFSFASADSEYLQDGTLQSYSLDGRFRSSTLTLGARYGFTDRFEMEVRPSFKHVSYEADPVILEIATPEDGDFSLSEARASVIDFSQSRIGAADMDVAARYKLWHGPVIITPELSAKIPLGYESPQGTFTDLSTFSVGDDVALGDGQIDLRAGLLLGAYIPWTRTFVRADVAYNHRLEEPGDQLLANGKLGQFLTNSFILFGGVRYARTLFQGEPIGQTFVDTIPDGQGAEDFVFEGNVEIQTLYLDRDFVIVEAGAILDLEKVELRFAIEEVVDGENFADLTTINVGVVATLPDVTRQKEQAEAEPSEREPEEEVIEEVIIEEVPVEDTGEQGQEEVIEEVIIEEVPVEDTGEQGADDQGASEEGAGEPEEGANSSAGQGRDGAEEGAGVEASP